MVPGWADQVEFTLDAGAIKDTYVLEYDWDVADGAVRTVSVNAGASVTFTAAVPTVWLALLQNTGYLNTLLFQLGAIEVHLADARHASRLDDAQ